MERIKEAVGAESFGFLKTARAQWSQRAYCEFWRHAEAPLFRGYFCFKLVKYVISCEKAHKAAGVSVDVALATLGLLVLALPPDTGDEDFRRCLEEAKREWTHFRSSHPTSNAHTDEMLTTLLTTALEGEREETLRLLLLHSCALCPAPRTFADLSYRDLAGESVRAEHWADLRHLGVEHPHPRFALLESGVAALCHTYMQSSFAQSMTLAPSHLALYHALFSEVRRYAKDGAAAVTGPLVLPLLHSLESALRRFPLLTCDLLERLAEELDLLRRWPQPYSCAAQRVLELLFRENKVVGGALVGSLREGFRFIDACLPMEHGWEQDKTALASAFIWPDSENTETGLLQALESLSQRQFFEKLRTAASAARQVLEGDPLALLAHAYRIQVLLFLHARYNTLHAQDLSHISGFGLLDVFHLYQRVLKMGELVQDVEAETARQLLSESMTDLLNEMERLHSDSSNPLTQVLLVFLSGNDAFTPQLPPDYLCIVEDSRQLVRLAERARDVESVFQGVPVRLVVAGSDSSLHWLLRGALETGMDMQLFVLPLQGVRSSLAQYLASVDSWYARYVYAPFARRPFVPRAEQERKQRKAVDPEESSRSFQLEDSLEDTAPTQALEGLLQDFLREARCILPLRLYEVRCWRDPSRPGPPDLRLPLALYLEVGLPAALLRARQTEEFAGKTPSEIAESKHFRYVAPALSIRTLETDLLGRTSLHEEEAVKEVRSLCVSNIPRESDCWPEALPAAEWLELALLEERAAGEEAMVRKRKANKQKLSDLSLALSALYTNLHVLEVSVRCERGCDVVVDGALYGPVGALELGPWETAQGWTELPLMTFLDTDL